MKKQISQQLWMLRFCISTAPKLFFFNLFACLEQSCFLFFEYTIWIGYNLNAAEEGAPFSQVAYLTLGVFILYLVHQFIDSIYFQWSFERIKPVLTFRLRRQIYEKARTMDLSCYDEPDFYNEFVLSTTQADQCVERFLEEGREFLRLLVQLLLYFSYLMAMDKAGLVLAVCCCLVNYLLGRAYYRLQEKARLERLPAERERAYQHRVLYLHEYAKELRLHPEMNGKIMKDFHECNERLSDISIQYGHKLWILGFLREYVFQNFMLYAGYFPWLLFQAMIRQNISLSSMVILLAAVRRTIADAGKILGCLSGLTYNSTFIGRIRSFLSYEPGIRSGEKEVDASLDTLTLSHVSFTYGSGRGWHGAGTGAVEEAGQESVAVSAKDPGQRPAGAAAQVQGRVGETLKDICLEIRKGEKIALVGYNGAGKTTLVKLLMRLYDPDSGVILWNGEDIRNLKLDQYRKGIGAVFQDYKIYAATLRENVAMDLCTGQKQETYQVEKALDRAGFHLEERKLKYQIDTPLTTEFEKEGVNLSGGESQKAAIARTLYRNQKLIIMDEPSSALDPASEYRLNQELKEIAEDKTVIFISHRLATARDADCIYMMKKGQIVEKGTHEQLLAMGGEYSRMWEVQARAYQ